MRNLVRKYKDLSFEQKIVLKTKIGLRFSAALACGKLIIGLFTDYNFVSIAIYTFAILLAKMECMCGIKTEKRTFRQRNLLIALFLFLASMVYIGFMCRMFFIERKIRNYGMNWVLILAFLSFSELGFAIAGLFRTKNKGHYYRNIKIINFCAALIAILTTQISILNLMSETGVVHIANAYSGIGVGCMISLCAVYILIAPKTSVIGREQQTFVLKESAVNRLIDMESNRTEIMLCRSLLYGDYLYRAKIENDRIDGEIARGKSLWKRMPLVWKIFCGILSELLVFVWLIGRAIFFFRSINLPQRLANLMQKNGFELSTAEEALTP